MYRFMIEILPTDYFVIYPGVMILKVAHNNKTGAWILELLSATETVGMSVEHTETRCNA